MFLPTTGLRKVAALRKRIRGVQGGTSASKTISIISLLIDAAQSDKTPTLTSIVSVSLPHLKRGAIRDFLAILQAHGYYQDARWNKSDFIYTFETGSKIEFFGADQPSKVRGPRRDRLFVNEANLLDYESFDQLTIRTNEYVFLDWNPTTEFWWHEKNLANRPDADFVILTYKDNEALSDSIISEIESHKNDLGWWRVYGLGLLGEVESRIYKGWREIETLPFEARLERYGLDFGYTNDPSAIIAIYYYNGGYIWDEVTFQKGLSNKQIADVFMNIPKALVIADSAEPKSIDEIKSFGINILPSVKGQGSVAYGIQWVQSQAISYTKRSANLANEYRKYVWMTDANGKFTQTPDHAYSHSMDAGRYGMESLRPQEKTLLEDLLPEEPLQYPEIGL